MSESLARRVVLAELAPQAKRQTAAALRRRHFQVTCANDRDDLISTVESTAPEVVVVDFGFDADMAGLLQTLRRVAPGVPVLVLTDKHVAEQAFRLADPTVADLVLKPFVAPELAFRVDRCIQTGRRARTAALRSAAERGELVLSPPMMSLAEPVSAPVPVSGPAGLRDPDNGRLDAKRIAEFLDVPLKQLAEGLGESYKAVHKTPSRGSLQPKLLPIERAITILGERLGDRGRTRAWLNTPHPDLAGRTALDVILAGDATAVSDMLEAAAAGLPS